MDILSASEIDEVVENSALVYKYNQDIDRESAFEMLEKKMADLEEIQKKANLPGPKSSTSSSRKAPQEESIIEELSKNTMVRQLGRTIFRELTRGILGSFKRKR